MRTEDGYIIEKCLNGDPAAFGLLVDKYRSSVYALAYAKLGNFHDAEDVAQEVFTSYVWVGTDSGLGRYDVERDVWTQFRAVAKQGKEARAAAQYQVAGGRRRVPVGRHTRGTLQVR